jgi:Protein of unknown function (DUF2630)
MSDESVLAHIGRLADEEFALEQRLEGHHPTEDERERLSAIEVELDQCWDLLRQRRARRHAGLDPDGDEVRDADVVEHYKQ